jgi:hypothetical protein
VWNCSNHPEQKHFGAGLPASLCLDRKHGGADGGEHGHNSPDGSESDCDGDSILVEVYREQETPATFTFSVDKTAPVQKNQTLKFVITAPSGEQWTKEITVAVVAPEKFEVYQNYPNPFNPSTAISYQLSAVSRVSLKIYNLLGQEVASLVDEDKPPGFHQETWDGTRCASGAYVYQLIATDDRGNKQISRKRMLLLK